MAEGAERCKIRHLIFLILLSVRPSLELSCTSEQSIGCQVKVEPEGSLDQCIISRHCLHANLTVKKPPTGEEDYARLQVIDGYADMHGYSLNISWLPPGDQMVTSEMTGFVLDLHDDTSMSCTVVDFSGVQIDRDQLFYSDCLPVSKNRNYILDITILPQGITTRYYFTIPDTINEQNLTANEWKPIIARRVNYAKREVKIFFQRAPDEFKYELYECMLAEVNTDHVLFVKNLETSVKLLKHTFTNVPEGHYFIRVTPEKCGGDGPSHSCFSTDSNFFNMFDKNTQEIPWSPEITTTPTTITKDISSSSIKPDDADNRSIIAAIVGTIGGFGLILIAILVYLRHKSKSESVAINITGNPSSMQRLQSGQCYSLSINEKPKILMLFADDMNTVGESLHEYLIHEWECEVYTNKDVPSKTKSEYLNAWVKEYFRKVDFVMFLCSAGARVLTQEVKKTKEQSTFVLGMNRARKELAELKHSSVLKKAIAVYFEGFGRGDIPYQLDKPGIKKYCLMDELFDLYSHINGTGMNNNVRLNADTYMQTHSGKRLYSALESMKENYTNGHQSPPLLLSEAISCSGVTPVIPPSPPLSYSTDDVMLTMRTWNEETDKCLQWMSSMDDQCPLSEDTNIDQDDSGLNDMNSDRFLHGHPWSTPDFSLQQKQSLFANKAPEVTDASCSKDTRVLFQCESEFPINTSRDRLYDMSPDPLIEPCNNQSNGRLQSLIIKDPFAQCAYSNNSHPANVSLVHLKSGSPSDKSFHSNTSYDPLITHSENCSPFTGTNPFIQSETTQKGCAEVPLLSYRNPTGLETSGGVRPDSRSFSHESEEMQPLSVPSVGVQGNGYTPQESGYFSDKFTMLDADGFIPPDDFVA